MDRQYRLFGLLLQSTCALPLPTLTTRSEHVDYFLSYEDSPHSFAKPDGVGWTPLHIEAGPPGTNRPGLIILRGLDSATLFQFYDGVEFLFEPGRRTLRWRLPGRATQRQAVDHLMYWLPRHLLELRGALFLRGAAVTREGRGIAFLGDSGSGKSTLALYLAALGYSVLSDDFVALTLGVGRSEVHAGYPWISLRPGAIEKLPIALERPPVLSKPWRYFGETYQGLDLRENGFLFQQTPSLLSAIYYLAPDQDSEQALRASRRRPRENLLRLLRQTSYPFHLRRLDDDRHVGQVSALVDRTPIWDLDYAMTPEALAGIGDLLDETVSGSEQAAIPVRKGL